MPQISGNPTTTASGLQYIDISPGDGPSALAGQTVRVHYTGWLESNGQKFDDVITQFLTSDEFKNRTHGR